MKECVLNYMNKFSTEEILRELIQIDTQNPTGNEKEAVNYICQFFKKKCSDLEVKVIEHDEVRASLIVKIAGTSHEGVAFLGHLDTVPVGDLKKWKTNPFYGKIENGKMYGRGTADMKSGVAVMLMVAGFFLDNHIIPSRDLYFLFTADEEGGSLGIQAIKKTGVFEGVKEVIIGEPTDVQVGIFEKGALGVELCAVGKEAHAAQAEKGINAIECLNEFVARLKKCMLSEQSNSYGDKLSLCITKIIGGNKNNVVPGTAKGYLDIRTIHSDEHGKLLESMQRLIREMKEEYGIEISYEIFQNRMPITVNENDPMIKELHKIFCDLDIQWETISIPYYTDMEEVRKDYPLSFAIFGPGAKEMAHQADEYVVLENVELVASVCTLYASQVCKCL